jgi:hypothetical protein
LRFSNVSAASAPFGSMPLEGDTDPVKSLGAKIAQGNPVLQHTAVGKHSRHGVIGVELHEKHVAEERVASCERMIPWLALHIAANFKKPLGDPSSYPPAASEEDIRACCIGRPTNRSSSNISSRRASRSAVALISAGCRRRRRIFAGHAHRTRRLIRSWHKSIVRSFPTSNSVQHTAAGQEVATPRRDLNGSQSIEAFRYAAIGKQSGSSERVP